MNEVNNSPVHTYDYPNVVRFEMQDNPVYKTCDLNQSVAAGSDKKTTSESSKLRTIPDHSMQGLTLQH